MPGRRGGALAAGNACVVKPAEDACLSLIRVAQLAAEVGFPAGAINIVTGYGHEVGDALARHPGIDHISFTGSPKVGTLIQQVAAERHCPVTLELGGKSPQIVFADADLDDAVRILVGLEQAGHHLRLPLAHHDGFRLEGHVLVVRLGHRRPVRRPPHPDPPAPGQVAQAALPRRKGGFVPGPLATPPAAARLQQRR